MFNQHVVKILDRSSLAGLSESDLKAVNLHIGECQDCRNAFEAARLSADLLKIRAADQVFEPSPYFQAKVLNTWREKQSGQNSYATFGRWWQASAALVFLMLTTVAALIALTVFAPNSNASGEQATVPSFTLYTADAVILNQPDARNLTTEQALEILNNSKNDAPRR